MGNGLRGNLPAPRNKGAYPVQAPQRLSQLLPPGTTVRNTMLCHGIKRCLLLGRKVMIKLDSILKSRDITLPTEVRLVKAMVFPLVMYVTVGL